MLLSSLLLCPTLLFNDLLLSALLCSQSLLCSSPTITVGGNSCLCTLLPCVALHGTGGGLNGRVMGGWGSARSPHSSPLRLRSLHLSTSEGGHLSTYLHPGDQPREHRDRETAFPPLRDTVEWAMYPHLGSNFTTSASPRQALHLFTSEREQSLHLCEEESKTFSNANPRNLNQAQHIIKENLLWQDQDLSLMKCSADKDQGVAKLCKDPRVSKECKFPGGRGFLGSKWSVGGRDLCSAPENLPGPSWPMPSIRPGLPLIRVIIIIITLCPPIFIGIIKINPQRLSFNFTVAPLN